MIHFKKTKVIKKFGEVEVGDQFYAGSNIDPLNCIKTSNTEARCSEGCQFTDISPDEEVRQYSFL